MHGKKRPHLEYIIYQGRTQAVIRSETYSICRAFTHFSNATQPYSYRMNTHTGLASGVDQIEKQIFRLAAWPLYEKVATEALRRLHVKQTAAEIKAGINHEDEGRFEDMHENEIPPEAAITGRWFLNEARNHLIAMATVSWRDSVFAEEIISGEVEMRQTWCYRYPSKYHSRAYFMRLYITSPERDGDLGLDSEMDSENIEYTLGLYSPGAYQEREEDGQRSDAASRGTSSDSRETGIVALLTQSGNSSCANDVTIVDTSSLPASQ